MKWERATTTDWTAHKANDVRGAFGLFLSARANKMIRKSRERLAKEKAKEYAKNSKKRDKSLVGSIAMKNSFTVGEAIEALRKLPKDETLWVSSTGLTGCGYIGHIEHSFMGGDGPRKIIVCQPLSPEATEANRKFRKGQTP